MVLDSKIFRDYQAFSAYSGFLGGKSNAGVAARPGSAVDSVRGICASPEPARPLPSYGPGIFDFTRLLAPADQPHNTQYQLAEETTYPFEPSLKMGGQKAIIVGLSGCSSSGKTTLARLLRDIFPNSFVLHEDDFYRPEDE